MCTISYNYFMRAISRTHLDGQIGGVNQIVEPRHIDPGPVKTDIYLSK